jgi:plastocyanin
MRFYGLALLAGAAVLGACGGEKAPAADTTTQAPVATTPTPAAPTNALAKIAATGATHTIKMVGDDKGYRYEPATLTIKAGDAVKFVMISGGPHNVAFEPAAVPADSKAQLDANMDNKMSELSSPLMMNPNEEYTVSFGGIKPGVYPFFCTPHLAMNMKGTITVQ